MSSTPGTGAARAEPRLESVPLMSDWLDLLLRWMLDRPPALIYPVLGAAAALENIIPPIPADVVILVGGFLAGQGTVRLWAVFLIVWLCNVAGAMLVYALGRRYGEAFFTGRWGRLILQPRQLASLDGFYRRYGFRVVFVSRFLPMFRAVVPVFAGVAGLRAWRTAVPIATASALWYGAIVFLGAAAGRNWPRILNAIEQSGRWFWLVALLALAVVARWWWMTRREAKE